MAKPNFIELGFGKKMERIPILYEDRSVLAIDKPAGWMLVPFSWQQTSRNLQAAITSSIAAGDFWARSRNLKFLRNVHRLDAETSGVLLFGKSPGAVESFSEMFESRMMEKVYLAIVDGVPKEKDWTCYAKLSQDPQQFGRMKVDPRDGKESETHFKLLQTIGNQSLIEAHPVTGRTHQIRIHLAEAGCPIVGDSLYGKKITERGDLGLRAMILSYRDPFTRRPVRIKAPSDRFVKQFGFELPRPEKVEPRTENIKPRIPPPRDE